MKIVDRNAFLSMPAGTIYSKFGNQSFGELEIKGESIGDVDFWSQSIADAIRAFDSEEMTEILDTAMETGGSVELDFSCEYRDGLYDMDQLFAVWELQDVEALIRRLIKAKTDIQK